MTIPRATFIDHVAKRSDATAGSQTTLEKVSPWALGEVMVGASITWRLAGATHAVSLVSDFLLQCQVAGQLRCVAYLPRTNLLDHI